MAQLDRPKSASDVSVRIPEKSDLLSAHDPEELNPALQVPVELRNAGIQGLPPVARGQLLGLGHQACDRPVRYSNRGLVAVEYPFRRPRFDCCLDSSLS
jgi:hypothetical protein